MADVKPPFNIDLRCSCGGTMNIEVHPVSYFDFSALVGLCNGWIEAHRHPNKSPAARSLIDQEGKANEKA